MPSEDRSTQALAALKRPREAFESALTEAIVELQAFIAEQRAPRDARVSQEAARLGEFAIGSFDAARFSALVAASEVMDAGFLTADLGGTTTTTAFTEQVKAILEK